MLFLGGDKDRRGFDVPDFAAIQYNTGLHRYEFTHLVLGYWDSIVSHDDRREWFLGLRAALSLLPDSRRRDHHDRHASWQRCRSCRQRIQVLAVMTTDLVHRYSFSETSGTVLADSVGGANAVLVDIAGTTNTSGLGGSSLASGSLRLFGGANAASDLC